MPRRVLRLFQSTRASVWTGVETAELAPRRPSLNAMDIPRQSALRRYRWTDLGHVPCQRFTWPGTLPPWWAAASHERQETGFEG
jgi:hypothetical protein